MVGETITLLLAALLHPGVPIPLGFTEHQIINNIDVSAEFNYNGGARRG
jgi:hypothetical protein